MNPAAMIVERLSFAYPPVSAGPGRPLFAGLSLVAVTGETSVVLARADEGKTTLARMLAGLVPRFTGGELSGLLRVGGRNPVRTPPWDLVETVGIVTQDSDRSILTTRCDSELAFALESLGVPREDMRRRVDEALECYGLDGLRARRPSSLSGGEKKRLLLACLAAVGPGLWVLDESLSELDVEWRERVLQRLAQAGRTVMILDSRRSDLADRYGRSFGILSGGAITASAKDPEAPSWRRALAAQGLSLARARAPRPGVRRGHPFLEAENLECAFDPPAGFALRVDSLRFERGQICALVGRNGSGKSTLARVLCGLQPARGRIRLDGARGRAATPDELSASVGYLFQNPDYQLHLPTVEEELALGLRMQGRGRTEIEGMIAGALELFRLPTGMPPALMSYGARKRLQAAIFHLLGRGLLILDEVDAGLSFREAEQIVGTLASSGAGIVLVTHDLSLAAALADRALVMESGRVAADVRSPTAARLAAVIRGKGAP